MEFKDYAELMAMENGGYGRHHNRNWGITTAVWVIAAVIVLAFIFWGWQKGCSEKQDTAVAVARLEGKIQPLETAVTAQGNNLYSLNGVTSATVQGVKDLKETTNNALFELNDEIFYNPSRRGRGSGGCGCGCGNREFRQSSTYNLASTQVTVDETCRN